MSYRLASAPRQVWSGTTEDLSLKGMRFLSQTPEPAGERVRIECDFCSAVAVVRFARPDPTKGRWQCGAEFLTLRLKHARGGLFSTVA